MAYLAQWIRSSISFEAFLPLFAMLMVAFAIKSALFPFCFWLPDSYHLTSVSTSSIFSGLLTKVGVYALIRTGTLFFAPDSPLMHILLVVSGFTMLSGVFGAMSDFHIRRILSFHIISQVGYMTLALAMGTTLAVTAGIFYIIHHILVKTNLFLISGALSRYSGHNDLRQMGDFFRQKPLLMILFLIPALSLSGVPPFSGFWAKYLLLQAAFASGFWLSAIIIIIVGFFTLYSMIKIWRYAFWQPTNEPMISIICREKILLYTPIIFLSLLTLMIGLFPETLYLASQQAAKALLQPECYLQTVLDGEIKCQP
jgi:multicomponent Na+:H+ antiporter subunit D